MLVLDVVRVRVKVWALAVLLLTGCVAGEAEHRLPAGEWTGDVLAPEVGGALGFLAVVPPTGDALEIEVLGRGFDGGPVEDLRISGDSLYFRWTSESRDCELRRESDGAFGGLCTRGGSFSWGLRLAPPVLRREPIGTARTALLLDRYAWRTHETGWGRLHVPGAVADGIPLEHRDAAIAAAIRTGLEILGGAAYGRPLDAFLVKGRPDVRALSGIPSASTAEPASSTVVLAGYGTMATVVRHEVMHVISHNLWGAPSQPASWLVEGLATYAGGNCADYTFHRLAAALARSGDVLPLRDLLHDFGAQDDVVTYLQGASLVQYLLEHRGRDYVREVWRRGLETVLAREESSLHALEEEWRLMLENRSLKPEAVDWSDIRGKGCG